MGNDKKTLMRMKQDSVKEKIYTIRGLQVMLDEDLAELYGVETKVFNQAVKRSEERFPKEFMFRLTNKEYESLRSQFVTSKKGRGGRRYLPYVFTEQGVSMLSAVLNSKTAIKISIQIINAFVSMRHFIADNVKIFEKLSEIERKQLEYEIKTDSKFGKVFKALESKHGEDKQGIFFDGQIFDAYVFVTGLIKKAKNSIIIIDNYVDETVLNMLLKRKKNVKVKILTKNIYSQLKLDISKHNKQYPKVDAVKYAKAHDRFIILDDKDIYHIGASLKDLGNKLFAFSMFEKDDVDLIKKAKGIK
jgi:hypothetical protein